MQALFNTIVLIIEFVGVGTVISLFTKFISMRKEQAQNMALIQEGQKCQLRSDMLRIYYHNKDERKIRQYEMENFIVLYKAYKLLGGNSFIDRIYEEVIQWEVNS